jgi:hypothetical protein
LKKKKVRPSKLGKKEKEEEMEEIMQNMDTINYVDFEKQENEPIYCFCNGPSYGDMVKCDNDSVIIVI